MGGKYSKKVELEKGVINSIKNENFIGPLPNNSVAILPTNQPILQLFKARNIEQYDEIPLEEVVERGEKVEVGVNTEEKRKWGKLNKVIIIMIVMMILPTAYMITEIYKPNCDKSPLLSNIAVTPGITPDLHPTPALSTLTSPTRTSL